MKKLILVRHGKSSWEENLPDEDRPLAKRAYADAELVLKAFRNHVPESLHMWSSPANRALSTARIFQNNLRIPDERFKIKEDLYTFNVNHLLKVIFGCNDSVENLMVFGHNPALTQLVNTLGDHPFDNVPTTGLNVLEFESDSWRTIKNGKNTLYLFPKHLR
ncbi:MAG: histidine phosphatase family protein [Salinimicrobium sp.]